MKLSIAVFATSLAVANAGAAEKWNNLRRRLSFEKIATYKPESQVSHLCVIFNSKKMHSKNDILSHITQHHNNMYLN